VSKTKLSMQFKFDRGFDLSRYAGNLKIEFIGIVTTAKILRLGSHNLKTPYHQRMILVLTKCHVEWAHGLVVVNLVEFEALYMINLLFISVQWDILSREIVDMKLSLLNVTPMKEKVPVIKPLVSAYFTGVSI
jgi:hypothetical protein